MARAGELLGIEDCFEGMRPRVNTLRCCSQQGELFEIDYEILMRTVNLMENSYKFLRNFVKNKEIARRELIGYAKLRNNVTESADIEKNINTNKVSKMKLYCNQTKTILPGLFSNKAFQVNSINIPSRNSRFKPKIVSQASVKVLRKDKMRLPSNQSGIGNDRMYSKGPHRSSMEYNESLILKAIYEDQKKSLSNLAQSPKFISRKSPIIFNKKV